MRFNDVCPFQYFAFSKFRLNYIFNSSVFLSLFTFFFSICGPQFVKRRRYSFPNRFVAQPISVAPFKSNAVIKRPIRCLNYLANYRFRVKIHKITKAKHNNQQAPQHSFTPFSCQLVHLRANSTSS